MADLISSSWLGSKGFQYVPDHQEMVELLQARLSGQPVPEIGIGEVDVYGHLYPHEIFAKSGPSRQTEIRYCFTPLKRMSRGGTRFVRTTGGGTWKIQNCKEIDGQPNFVVRLLSYQKRIKSGSDDRPWVMYEYSLKSSCQQHLRNNDQDIALCKIKPRRLTEKRDREDDQEEVSASVKRAKARSTRVSVNVDDNNDCWVPSTPPYTVDVSQGDCFFTVEELLGMDDQEGCPIDTNETEPTFEDVFSNKGSKVVERVTTFEDLFGKKGNNVVEREVTFEDLFGNDELE